MKVAPQPLPTYRMCNSCGQISAIANWHHSADGQIKCSTCGKVNWNEEWPDASILNILQIVFDAPTDTPYFERLSCLLLAACLEDMMNQQLRIMAIFGSSWEDVEFLMAPLLDAYRGRQRQLQLYGRIGYGSFKSDCIEAGLPEYPAQWHRLAEQRNHFAHSPDAPKVSLSPSEIYGFIADTLTVFSGIHNKYNRDTIHYNTATHPPRPGELRKLMKELEELDDEQ